MSCRISDACMVQRTANQVCCNMEGESVILNLTSGTYHSLDAVAARIWALIEQPTAIADVREAILKEYDVDADACERDVLAFIEKMDAAGLIEVRNGTGA